MEDKIITRELRAVVPKLDILTFECQGSLLFASKKTIENSCSYLKALVSTTWRREQGSVNHIVLKYPSCEAFRSLLYFASNKQLRNSNLWKSKDWIDRLKLAHEYQYTAFLTKLLEELDVKVYSFTEILEMIRLSIELNVPKLFGKCFCAIDAFADLLLEDEKVLQLIPEDVMLVILNRSTLYIEEVKLLKALCRWIEIKGCTEPLQLVKRINWSIIPRDSSNVVQSFVDAIFSVIRSPRVVLERFCWQHARVPRVNLVGRFFTLKPQDVEISANASQQNTPVLLVTEFCSPLPFYVNKLKIRINSSTNTTLQWSVYCNDHCQAYDTSNGSLVQELRFRTVLVDEIRIRSYWVNAEESNIVLQECSLDNEEYLPLSLASNINNQTMQDHEDRLNGPLLFPFQLETRSLQKQSIRLMVRQTLGLNCVILQLRFFSPNWELTLFDNADGNPVTIIKQRERKKGLMTEVSLEFVMEKSNELFLSGENVILNLIAAL